jgi:hypothetical protein
MASERDCVDHLVRVVAHSHQSLRETVALGLGRSKVGSRQGRDYRAGDPIH